MKRFLSPPFLKDYSLSKKLAFIALFTAVNIVSNMLLETRIFDIQYSLTIVFSFISGLFLGPLYGFLSCLLGDFIGYLINSWGQLYMPWVGVSTGFFAFISGLVFSFKSKKTYMLFVKAAIFAFVSFLVCTVLINSSGFYLYNKKLGFGEAFLAYTENLTGYRYSSFYLYICYRLIFKGQIFNSIVNYALIFVLLPMFNKIPSLNNLI